MLGVWLSAYLVVAAASLALLVPRVRRRLPFPWLRRMGLCWSAVVLAYTFFAPACVYLPSIPASPSTRRILLGIEFVPPLRLARMKERELRWELVRSDGRRSPYPAGPEGSYLGRFHIVANGGAVLTTGLERSLLRLDPNSTTWGVMQRLERDTGGYWWLWRRGPAAFSRFAGSARLPGRPKAESGNS